jgi:hypothetical protein
LRSDCERDITGKSGERRHMPLPSLSQKAFKASTSFIIPWRGGMKPYLTGISLLKVAEYLEPYNISLKHTQITQLYY